MQNASTLSNPAATLALPPSAPAAARALFALLRRLQVGTLDVQLPDGGQIRFGSGVAGEPHAAVTAQLGRLRCSAAGWRRWLCRVLHRR